jgi:hypothetical protein
MKAVDTPGTSITGRYHHWTISPRKSVACQETPCHEWYVYAVTDTRPETIESDHRERPAILAATRIVEGIEANLEKNKRVHGSQRHPYRHIRHDRDRQ